MRVVLLIVFMACAAARVRRNSVHPVGVHPSGVRPSGVRPVGPRPGSKVVSPTWQQNFSPAQYGQVDNVAFANGQLFASLLANVALVGFNATTGVQSWARQPELGEFGMAAAGGQLVCVIDFTSSTLFLSCYGGAVPAKRLWQLRFPGGVSNNLAVSEDGSTVALGLDTLYNSTYTSTILLLDGATGRQKKSYSCNSDGTFTNVTTGLLALDPTGTVVAYTCIHLGSQTATIFVRDSTLLSSTRPLLQTSAAAASGTGFALSRHGGYFAFGVSSTHVYRRVGAVYQLLFTRSPVSPYDGRLLDAIAFDTSDAKPLLATGYYTVYNSISQQSFVEVFDLGSANPAQPAWVYNFVNTTSPYQDAIGQISICGSGPSRIVAIGTWGVGPNSTHVLNAATVHAFSAAGTKVLSYNTAGSMFGIACSVSPKNVLFVGAGGKHEHANVMGSGGDVYGFITQL